MTDSFSTCAAQSRPGLPGLAARDRRDAIAAAPGAVGEIADRFGVSRQPVREAFIKLAENQLVQISC